MINGDPGAGKTTFIKRLCYIWAQSVLHPEKRPAESDIHHGENDIEDGSVLHSDTEDEYLHKYTLVIPIILRFISKQNTLSDIFTSQLQCLNICEICALVDLAKCQPNELLLLLDGYDEYAGHSFISKVISKEECTDILTVTTSRPHAVDQLRRHTSQAVEQHFRICGFNEAQVKAYIEQFCEYHRLPSDTGKELTKTLFEERPDILEVAKIPIRTEMICIVWAAYGKLGKTWADLYDLFIIHLIKRWETKQNHENVAKKELSQHQVLKTNQSILLKLGSLANTWEKQKRLKIVFSTEELDDILGEDFDKVIKIGILTKSHPSDILQKSNWSFPHLTFQEYFVAYFLGNDISASEQFASKCKDYRVLQRYNVIFMFLCCQYFSVANKILTFLVYEEKDENKCMALLKFISEQTKYYENNTINIPLMYSVNIKSIEEHVRHNNPEKRFQGQLLKRSLYRLLESEKIQAKPNLHSLAMCNILEYKDFMDLAYLQRLDVSVSSHKELLLLDEKIKHLEELKTLCIEIQTEKSENDSEYSSEESLCEMSGLSFTDVDLVSSIPTKNLTSLSLIGLDAMKAAGDHTQKFTALEQLHIDEASSTLTEETRKELLTSLKSTRSVAHVSLCLADLDDRILQEKLNMKISLQVKQETLTEDALRKAGRVLDLTGSLHKLELSGNNLKNEGESLGQIMARMTTLRILCVCGCNIKANTIQRMVQTIKKVKSRSKSLHTLDISGKYRDHKVNNLHTGGSYLGELVDLLIPHLNILDLAGCDLTDPDLAAMSGALTAKNSIYTLNLRDNKLNDSSKGLDSLLSHTSNLQELAVGGLLNPVPIQTMCRAAKSGSLTTLLVLDMSLSQLQPGCFEKLGHHLRYMKTLNVINLGWVEGVQADDYQHIYSNLPPSLQHLNVYNPHINFDVYLILDQQLHLIHLHRLNVKLSDPDIELLQEMFEQHNPHIQVYNDSDEDIWRMYVLEKNKD